jgi:hypothetical protein
VGGSENFRPSIQHIEVEPKTTRDINEALLHAENFLVLRSILKK